MNNLIEDLNWRYAVKEFDTEKKLSDEDFNTLLESLRLSPSSFGLQPWKFVVVENNELREKLVEKSWGQKQVSQASHLIVLCRKNDLGDSFVDEFLDDIVKTRGGTREDIKGYEDVMKGFLSRMDDEKKANWANMQIYIALGQLMTTAAHMRIDTCPMEGFIKPQYDEILNLKDMGLSSVVVCPVGYRASTDKYATTAKVRFAMEDLVVKI